jgi:HSP20 family molecular chaperone IbpA
VSYLRDGEARQRLAALRERMNQLLDGMTAAEPWMPPADVYRERNRIVITLELPGVAVEAVAVETVGSTLRVCGQRPVATPPPPGSPSSLPRSDPDEPRPLQLERSYGPFLREFQLPASARAEKHRVYCENGVLRIEIPID